MEDKKHKNIDGDGEEGPPVSSDKRAAHGRWEQGKKKVYQGTTSGDEVQVLGRGGT